LAKMMDARICTTDFNLSRIASIQGVEMLNINDLVNSVKPVVFTGEELEIKLLKEGKEPSQAIGYLEDGTMVVVNQGQGKIGQDVEVQVQSLLQTGAGVIVFAEIKPAAVA